jgi:hypothetical protein
MLYFVIGLPGRFTEWCDAATAEIAQRALGPTELVRADTLEEISLWMIRTGASRGVVASRQPGGRLRSALIEASRTFLVVVEEPQTALAEAVQKQRNDVAAGITRYVSSPGALALFRDRDGSNPVTTTRAIAHHFALNVRDADIAEIVDGLAAAGLTFERSDGASQWDGLGVEEQRVVDGGGRSVRHLSRDRESPADNLGARALFSRRSAGRAGDGPHRRHRTCAPAFGWAPYNAAARVLVAVATAALFTRDHRT